MSTATKEDFFIARSIKGHTSEKLSEETSTTGTYSNRVADILTSYDLVNYCQAFYSLQQSTGASNVHVPYSFPTWRFASDKLIVLAKTVFLSVSLIEIKPKNCWVTFWFPFSVFHVKNLALNMKLTADLILQSPQYTNALRDRELDLRGKFSCLTFTPKGYLPLMSNVSPISFVFRETVFLDWLWLCYETDHPAFPVENALVCIKITWKQNRKSCIKTMSCST